MISLIIICNTNNTASLSSSRSEVSISNMAEEVAILMGDTEGWRVPGRFSTALGKVTGSTSVTVQKVLRGELLVAIKSSSSQKGKEGSKEGRPPPNFHLKKDPNVVLHCNAQNITPLVSRDEVQLLEGVTSSASRHVLFVHASRLEWAVSLTVDKEVFIHIPGPNLSIPSSGVGVIRYIGPVTGLPGRHFGVEIIVSLQSLCIISHTNVG